jgi:S-adenosylmethionine hydrolase
MPRPIITLTTDFGEGSHYVAQMKGVILSINPEANIVDISHAVPPQDVRQGALALDEASRRFPPDSIHVAVVDPGVGTDRNITYACIGNRHYVAPDNGLLSLLAHHTPPSQIIVLANPEYWLPEVSFTFHGRDIMAPVAAHLSLGVDPNRLGMPADDVIKLTWPEVRVEARRIEGSVVSFDSFGNLITDITAKLLAQAATHDVLQIRCGKHEIRGLVMTYHGSQANTLVALIGSSGLLELSVVNGNAAKALGVEVGAEVSVTW